MSTIAWSCTAAIVTPAPTSSGYSPSRGCSRRSPTPNCAWSQARRWRGWWCGRRNLSQLVLDAKSLSLSHRAVIRVYDEAGNVIETPSSGAVSPSSRQA